MIKGSIKQEAITFVNICGPNMLLLSHLSRVQLCAAP